MRHFKSAYLIIGLICGLSLTSIISMSAGTTGGTESDPIVTKSYVEKRLLEIQTQLNDTNQAALLSLNTAQETKNASMENKLNELTTKLEALKNTTGASANDFVLVQVKKGDLVTTVDSGMIIMRAGTATAVASASGGLSNLTEGKNLSTGQSIETNHLILIPKNDGRGIKMTYDGWLMIKGSYKMQSTK